MAAITADDCAYSGLPNKLVSATNGVDYAYRDTDVEAFLSETGGTIGMIPRKCTL